MLEFIFLILGLLGLVIGSHLIIKGGLNIAEHYKISQFFIGLTIFAIGSDLPELFIDITGAIKKLNGFDTSELIIGETIGTCLGQIALTLGIVGLFSTLTLKKRELQRDGLLMVGSVALLFFLGFDGEISKNDGIILILTFLIYFISLFREEKIYEKIQITSKIHLTWAIFSIIGGFAILIYSSSIVVDNALILATIWGVSQSIIGIFIVGLGTSLPEMVISLSALRKRAFRLSVGNLIGSNIFDILFTLGISSAISGFIVDQKFLKFDIPFLFATSIIVLIFFGKRKKIDKKEAIALISIYITYVLIKLFLLK